MKTLTIGTINEAKVKQIRGALLSLGIEVNGVENKSLLPVVEEDGSTAQENAKKKAVAYARVLDRVVLSMDNALFIDGLSSSQQPGINVRRINGRTKILLFHDRQIRAEGEWSLGVRCLCREFEKRIQRNNNHFS